MNSSFSWITFTTSICALCLTLYQLYATKRHNKLSVRPHLSHQTDTEATPQGMLFSYFVGNNGIGPAKITKVEIFRNGRLWPIGWTSNITALLEEHFKDRLNYQFRKSYIFGIESLRPGDGRIVLQVFFPDKDQKSREEIIAAVAELKIWIEYESFYGEKFVFTSDSEQPILIEKQTMT